MIYLEGLKVSFYKYFLQHGKEKKWIPDPLSAQFYEVNAKEKVKLIKLSVDYSLNFLFYAEKEHIFYYLYSYQ